MTFLWRAAGGSADGSDWSAAAVGWAQENGLTDGRTFTAKADCPLADVVYCLWVQLAGQITDGQESQAGEAEYVTGNTTRGYHAWNVVKIEYPEISETE